MDGHRGAAATLEPGLCAVLGVPELPIRLVVWDGSAVGRRMRRVWYCTPAALCVDCFGHRGNSGWGAPTSPATWTSTVMCSLPWLR